MFYNKKKSVNTDACEDGRTDKINSVLQDSMVAVRPVLSKVIHSSEVRSAFFVIGRNLKKSIGSSKRNLDCY